MSRFNAINTEARGLKCDNPACNWCDMTIPSADYRKWINAPCPKCGDNLMTPKNYRAFRNLTNVIRLINVVWFPAMFVRWVLRMNEDRRLTKVDSRPDGSMTLTTNNPEGEPEVIELPSVN